MRFEDHIAEMEKLARFHFRQLGAEAREEMTDRVVTLGFLRWGQLEAAGKLEPATWRSAVWLTIKQVKLGRRLEGQTERVDPLEAALRAGFRATSWESADRPAETAAVRVDLAAYAATLTDRDREILQRMVRGAETDELARDFGISPGRISQLRRKFYQDLKG